MLKVEHQHELVAHERCGRISILGDIPSKPSGDGSGQLTLGALAGAARMLDQMISRVPSMIMGIHSLYSEEKINTKPPPELWGSVFMAIILKEFFLKGAGRKRRKTCQSIKTREILKVRLTFLCFRLSYKK